MRNYRLQIIFNHHLNRRLQRITQFNPFSIMEILFLEGNLFIVDEWL